MKRNIAGFILIVAMILVIGVYVWPVINGGKTEPESGIPAEATKFLFLSHVWGEDMHLNLYTTEKSYTEVGVLPDSDHSAAQLVADREVYFIDAYNGLSIFNLNTKKTQVYPIPELKLGEPGSGIVDFLIDGQTIYYLRGVCSEGFPDCDLMRFSSSTGANEVIAPSLETGPVCGMSIDRLDVSTNSLYLIHSCGDAGVSLMDVKKVDLATKEVTTIESYSARYCGEPNEYCDEEQLKKNADYNERWAMSQTVTCGDITMFVPENQVFVGCKQ